jgi:hypothetical protein
MSKVAITGNASGTGTLTIAAPNTNTDRTLTLPDNTGTILTNATAGTVLQVVTATSTGGAISTTSDTMVDTGVSITITPTSASSKILVSFTFTSTSNNTDAQNGTSYNIYRNDTTALFVGSAAEKGPLVYFSAAGYVHAPNAIIGVDLPSTTSATEYSLYFRRIVSGQTGWIQRDWGGITMIAMEIAT